MTKPPVWHTAHPLWMCGMRPFFLLAMGAAIGLLAWWSLVLAAGLPAPAVAGGAVVWHVHELVFGFSLAAVAGFALTAIPEFTGQGGATRSQLRALVGLWLLGRAGFWGSGLVGTAALGLAALAHLGLLAGLAAVLARPLWGAPAGRRHVAFWWALLALAGAVAGFYADALRGLPGLRWLHLALGVLMLLIVVAMSRISMRIVNRAIELATPGAPPYLARPPRRHLATLCIALYTGAEFVQPGTPLAGWLALAAAAALCNLMSDWHVGRALLRRAPLMLYAVYACMALGYALLGLAQLGAGGSTGAGRHLLTMGAAGLNIFVVVFIAGRAHCGLPPDTSRWIPLAAALLLLATAVRAGAAWVGGGAPWLGAAGALWCAAFVVLLWRIGPALWRPRADGQQGCEGP
ncbi:MAG: NnrS family protein [Acidovorax sp.]|nr:NnrS family protein [Acidovorax sp.]